MISNIIDKFLHTQNIASSNICLLNLQSNLNNTSLNNSSKVEITIENDENYFETIQHLNFKFNIYKYNSNNNIIDLDDNQEFINQFIQFYKSNHSESIIFLINQRFNFKFKSTIHQLLNQLSTSTKVIFLLNKNDHEDVIVDPSKEVVNELELFKLNQQWFIYSSSSSEDLKVQGLYWLTQNL